jgi:hypothetical protein
MASVDSCGLDINGESVDSCGLVINGENVDSCGFGIFASQGLRENGCTITYSKECSLRLPLIEQIL